jgi:type I restriction enzyme S subunit
MAELDSIDLEPRHLKKIRSIFARHLPYKKVWAYGSRVKWTASNTSDLDCVVFGATDSEIANAREAFDESDIPFEVQLLNWGTIPDDFKKNIKEGYFILQNKWDWRETTLGDNINIKHGYAFKGQYITTDVTNDILVTPGNFYIGGGFKHDKFKYFHSVYPKNYVLKKNDVVLTMTDLSKEGDTLGYAAKVPEIKGKNFLHNQRIGLVEFLSKNVDNNFIYWLMRTKDYQGFIVGSASGTAIRHTSPASIKAYGFLLPPISEQKAIASVLSSIDDKIDLLHRQNNTLESIAETIFRQWFIEEADDSWEKKSLKKIANYLNGLACQKYPPKNDFDKLPVLKIKDLKNGLSKDSDWSTSDVEKEYIVQKGDIIFSWSGSLLVKIWDGETCVLNQHLFKVTSDQYHKWFIYLWTNYHLAKFIAIAESKATTMGHIKKTDLDDAIIILPSDTELKHMDKIMIPIIDKIIVNNTQIKTLESLRDTLLPKLISGDIRVEYEEVS